MVMRGLSTLGNIGMKTMPVDQMSLVKIAQSKIDRVLART